ncbi:MAG: DUF6686 family protein [Bacteroidota bacterium]
MCEICQYLDLVETDECQINYCKACKTFSVVYRSCCASFTPSELEQFHVVLSTLRETDFHYNFCGEHMAIIKNPVACVGFCLSKKDASELADSVAESLTLFDAYHVIYK